MRYGEDHKAETRDRVVKAAANAMRRLGPDRVSVADVMSEVGLTHGGFYAHFKSKDALVGAAVEAAFGQSRKRLARMSEDPQVLLAEFVDFYVSRDHRDFPERGCPIALLSSDIPRQGEPARRAFDTGVHGLIDLIATRLAVGAPEDRAGLAGSLMAEMAGAVALSRAVSDPDLSDRLLTESRGRIKARMGLTPSFPEQGERQ